MASLVRKVIRGHAYYYLVQTAWVNGRSRYVRQRYLGRADDILRRLEEAAAPQPEYTLGFEFGGSAALYAVAHRLGLVALIDRHAPKRAQGLTVGQYSLLAVLNRCLAPAPKTQLAAWYAQTILHRLLPADKAQLSSQRVWDHMGALSVEAIQAIERDLAARLLADWGIDARSLVYAATHFFTYLDTRTRAKLPQRGHNKARRIDLRQVSLGLLVSRDYHIPLFHDTYPGNRPDATEFRAVLQALTRRYQAVFPPPHDITLVFDKGNNCPEGFALLAQGAYHFIGALVPTQHPDLLAIPRRRFQPLAGERLQGVRAYRTTRSVYGADRTVVVTWNPALYKAQLRGLLTTLNKKKRRLAALARRLRRRRETRRPKGKAPTEAAVRRQVEALRQARHLRALLRYTLRPTARGLTLRFSVDEAAKARLLRELFGKTLLFTDQHAWSTEDIVLGYRGQYKLEDGFRLLKDHDACCWWPMQHWTDQKIRVHAFHCVLALLLVSLLQRQLAQQGIDLSIPRLLQRLSDIEETAVVYPPRPVPRGRAKPTTAYALSAMDAEQRRLFEALDLQHFARPSR
jgi:transposase